MARVYRFNQLGGPEVLQLEELPLAPPGPQEVRVRIHAIGLNRADVMFRRGNYVLKADLPSRLGYEASGTVTDTGSGVTSFRAGDEVSVLPPDNPGVYGTYADEINIPASCLVHKPAILSFEAAAAVWMQYLTAWGGVMHACRLQRGQYIVVTAAVSSVGIAALEIALLAGAVPVAVTRKSDRHDVLRAMGVQHIIVSDGPGLREEVEKITGPDGLDCAFDAVGGPFVAELAAAMKPFGRIVIHGFLSDKETLFPVRTAIRKSLAVEGYFFAEILRSQTLRNEASGFLLEGLITGKLNVMIDRTFRFEEMTEAHRYMESENRSGKVVVLV
ncbi:zinc-dependent alcohol dehydrogenase family protein [Enterobacter sp. Acro-832]|uniref:zinc-dependent alcohol dehydrogenase family protein n=1 Tax=Enterobacter sp. Acro-832 TaxID=2608348 RepID=UPI001421578F|nr:zinc-dependent alcohol dehydrogenase family protein [Enterobacter sp. Acro-832]NIG46437.1 zinc-dependent alcohol dehydrogenase family protein [Enterobacter sp. Acro-832]